MNTYFVSFFFLLLSLSCSHQSPSSLQSPHYSPRSPSSTHPKTDDSCLVHKAGVDMGSGSFKVLAVKFDACKNEIVEKLTEEKIKISLQEDLDRSRDGKLSMQIQEEALKKIADLKNRFDQLYPHLQWKGVGTAALRNASNGQKLVDRIYREVSIPIQIIAQEDEAKLGFLLIASKLKTPGEELLVWDIGGGSMQLTGVNAQKKWVFYKGPLASVSLKNFIIEFIQEKNLQEAHSPNPIGSHDFKKMIQFIHWYASLHLPKEIKDMVTVEKKKIIGIGSVHNISLKMPLESQFGESSFYQQNNLMEYLKKEINKTDEEINNPYAETQVTNGLLVLGFMKSLQLEQVYYGNAELVEATFFDFNNKL